MVGAALRSSLTGSGRTPEGEDSAGGLRRFAIGCAAQDTSGLRGEILRLDVSHLPPGAGGPPQPALITPPGNPFPNGGLNARLIWAFGLRNPFRFQIDPLNGALLIGDVGENSWEEVDRAPVGGLDFGWSRFEGPASLDPSCTLTEPASAPIHAYYRNGTEAAIVGGPLYRAPGGAASPFPGEYDGDYFFSDYYQGFLRRLKGSGTSWLVGSGGALLSSKATGRPACSS